MVNCFSDTIVTDFDFEPLDFVVRVDEGIIDPPVGDSMVCCAIDQSEVHQALASFTMIGHHTRVIQQLDVVHVNPIREFATVWVVGLLPI